MRFLRFACGVYSMNIAPTKNGIIYNNNGKGDFLSVKQLIMIQNVCDWIEKSSVKSSFNYQQYRGVSKKLAEKELYIACLKGFVKKEGRFYIGHNVSGFKSLFSLEG